ncbi:MULTISPECIES: cation:proton antiporter regulatory subunit [unclassified Agrococcus]|uniref:cation:proton antiporter regulatory subunit n=1 Tax=unclassified Agrococcus TaxID=2615065 RepID=UPI0036198DC9
MDITQTLLPGVGVRYDMTTRKGVPVSVVVHREGPADLCVSSKHDPDDVRLALHLDEEEIDALTDVLGAHRITQSMADVTRAIPGLETARLLVDAGSPFVGRPLGDTRARTLTGCSIVAVVRADDVIAAPTPAEPLLAGDSLVAIGSAQGLAQLRARLLSG